MSTERRAGRGENDEPTAEAPVHPYVVANYSFVQPLDWHAVEHGHVWPDGVGGEVAHATWRRIAVNWDHGHPTLVQVVVSDMGFHGTSPRAVGVLLTTETARRIAEALLASCDSAASLDGWMQLADV